MVGDRIKDTIQIYKEVSMRRWGEKSTLISESSGKASLDYLTMANGGGGLGYANVGVGFLGLLRTFLGSVVLETSAGLLGSSFRHSHGGGGNSQHGGRGGCEHGTPVHDFRVRACRAPYWCHLDGDGGGAGGGSDALSSQGSASAHNSGGSHKSCHDSEVVADGAEQTRKRLRECED